MAGSFTLTFQDSGKSSDDNTKQETVNGIIDEGKGYVASVKASNVYQARQGNGIKLGTSSKTGELVIKFDAPVKITSIVANAKQYKDSETTLKIQDKDDFTLTKDFADYTFTYDAATTVDSILLGTKSKRNYIKSVTINVEGEAPTPHEVVEPKNLGEKTIAEFLALKNEVDTCILTGVVLNITKADAGQLYMADETDTIYVYNVKTPSGEAYKFNTLGVNVGDTLTIKSIYGEHDGVPQANQSIYVSHIAVPAKNLGEKTIAEFLALKNAKDTCILTGVVDSIYNTEYGNLFLVDATDTLNVFGVLTPEGEAKKFDSLDVAVSDTLTIKAVYSEYNNKPQAKNVVFVEVKKAAPVVETTWTVAGSSATLFGTAWDPTNNANDMEEVEGIFVWEKEGLELAAGDIAFKVVKDHAWDEAYPAQDYKLAIDSAGIYTIKITFNPESKEVAAEATKTGEAVVLPNIILHGNFTGSWKDTEAFVPAEDKLTAALELELAEGTYEFGFKFDGAWKANGANLTREENTTNLATGDGNMHITADKAGKYVFTYTYATQGLIVAYPSAAEADTIVIDALTYGEVLTEDFEDYGAVDVILTNIPIVGNQLLGDGCTFVLDILPEDANNITGRYSVDSLSLDTAYSGIVVYQGTDTTMLSLANAEVIFQIGQVSVENKLAQLAVMAELVTEDGTVFEIAASTVVYYEFVEEQGIEEIMAESENGKAIKLMHEGQIYILKGNKLYNLSGQVVR